MNAILNFSGTVEEFFHTLGSLWVPEVTCKFVYNDWGEPVVEWTFDTQGLEYNNELIAAVQETWPHFHYFEPKFSDVGTYVYRYTFEQGFRKWNDMKVPTR